MCNIVNRAALLSGDFASLLNEEISHLLKCSLIECHGAVLAFGYSDELDKVAVFLQCFGKVFALAIRHYGVGIAMNHKIGRASCRERVLRRV